MTSYLRLHVCLVLVTALWASACTSSANPKMSVIGVKAPRIQRFDAPSMKVFVEVHNPTRTDLSLDRLSYRLVAKDWFDSRGEVKLERVIASGASAIVEISVPVQEGSQELALHGVPYELKARLFVTTDKVSRSWELSSKGSLASSRHSSLASRRVAAGL